MNLWISTYLTVAIGSAWIPAHQPFTFLKTIRRFAEKAGFGERWELFTDVGPNIPMFSDISVIINFSDGTQGEWRLLDSFQPDIGLGLIQRDFRLGYVYNLTEKSHTAVFERIALYASRELSAQNGKQPLTATVCKVPGTPIGTPFDSTRGAFLQVCPLVGYSLRPTQGESAR